MRRRRALSLVPMLALACDTEPESQGETADEVEPWSLCETTTSVLSGPDAVGTYGVRPRLVIEEAQGTYVGTLAWENGGPVGYSGALGSVEVEVELSYVGGELRDVAAQLIRDCAHDGPCSCLSRVEVDMQMSVRTSDGVLDESWTVPVQYLAVSDGFTEVGMSIRRPLQIEEFGGTLSEADLVLGPADHYELSFEARLEGGALSGSLGVLTVLDDSMLSPLYTGGVIAHVSAVTSLESCGYLEAHECAAAGCSTVMGTPVSLRTVDPVCECATARPYCWPAAPSPEVTPNLFVRSYQDGWHDVAWIGAPGATGAWQLCSETPDTDACVCLGHEPLCD